MSSSCIVGGLFGPLAHLCENLGSLNCGSIDLTAAAATATAAVVAAAAKCGHVLTVESVTCLPMKENSFGLFIGSDGEKPLMYLLAVLYFPML